MAPTGRVCSYGEDTQGLHDLHTLDLSLCQLCIGHHREDIWGGAKAWPLGPCLVRINGHNPHLWVWTFPALELEKPQALPVGQVLFHPSPGTAPSCEPHSLRLSVGWCTDVRCTPKLPKEGILLRLSRGVVGKARDGAMTHQSRSEHLAWSGSKLYLVLSPPNFPNSLY